jgi:hypothetical protein
MFWKRLESDLSQRRPEELRVAFTDRLRAALDFATLGAYELTPELDHDDPSSTPAGTAAWTSADSRDGHETDRERARPPAFAGTKEHPEPKPRHRCDHPAEPSRLHVSGAGHGCAAGESAVARGCAWERASRASRRPGRGDRRPGALAPEQPCTWGRAGL